MSPNLASPDTNDFFHRENKDLPVAELTCFRRTADDVDRLLEQFVRDDHVHFHFGQKINRVLAATIVLSVPFLAANTPNVADRHAEYAKVLQGPLDLFQLVRPDNAFQLFHRSHFSFIRKSNTFTQTDNLQTELFNNCRHPDAVKDLATSLVL